MSKVWESLNNESNFKAHLSIFLEFAKGSNENDFKAQLSTYPKFRNSSTMKTISRHSYEYVQSLGILLCTKILGNTMKLNINI